MPLPKPNDGETKDEFMDRCMSDGDVQAEADDEDQAFAICNQLWEDGRAMAHEREKRFLGTAGTELRVRRDEEGEVKGIGGTAALFNTRTTIGGMFEEEIADGAFDEALPESDIRGLFNHDANFVLGRTSSGTMEVGADDDGLQFDIAELPESRADVLEAIERGDVTGNSFSFTVAEERWIEADARDDGAGLPLRIIERIGEVFDVGPVTFPAYEETTVSARAEQRAQEMAEAEPEPEEDVDDEAEREKARERMAVKRRRMELQRKRMEGAV